MRASIVGLMLALLAPAAAQAADIGGRLFFKAGATEDQHALLALPGVDFSTQSVETAAILDGRQGGFRFRVRAEAFGAPGDWPAHADIRLKELSYGRALNETWAVSAGLQQRSWDSGVAYQPLGFFRSRTDLSDPFDTEARQQGLPMVVVTRLGEHLNLEAVASDRLSSGARAQDLNGRQWAVRISGDPLPKVNASLIVRQRSGAAPGVGVSTTYAIGPIELHADGFYGPPDAQVRYAGFYGPPALRTTDPFALETDLPAAVGTVVGATWTPIENLALRAEWSHRGDAPANPEIDRYFAGVDLHRAALQTPAAGLAFQNLAWDLTASRAAAGRDQVFVLATLGGDKTSLSVSTLFDLEDGSTLSNVGVTLSLPYRVGLGIGATIFAGGDHTAFGALPFKGSAYLSLSRAF